ncbi:MAG: ABC-2 type transport system ATP-binding protein [Flavobacteriales bacterium]|jgi:ABC-2 type transport system ATP-binding protein
MIECKHLSKSFNKLQVLNDVNFELAPDKITGIVGKNGAGKTTLFKCLTGLEEHDGTIISPFKPLKDSIGYLPTSPYFISRLTGKEYLTMVLKARGMNADNVASKNIFDLPLQSYASNYSTGMKKKLALLGVLLQKNEVFIFDEPFNGVDIEGNMLISGILNELKAQGKYILLSSHIFSSLKTLSDSIFVLDQGKLSNSILPPDYAQLEQDLAPKIEGAILSKLEL